jgi:NAD(P)H-hydrate repair Nnr-like enzyme with NAD(P)H-hydrate dehydratase domain
VPTVLKKWSIKDAKKCIAVPSDLDNKYSRGVLGAITGSAQYPGASVLTTSAAAATGVGMIRFYASSGLDHLVLHETPSVVCHPGNVSAWIVGSGIDARKYSSLTTWIRYRHFKSIKIQGVPTVLDAGALKLAGKLEQPTVITPHSGELARLLNSRGVSVTAEALEGNPKKWVVIAAKTLGVTVLLKGSRTYVANDSNLIELPVATPWLATAGTGDVLAGILGALVATHLIEILNDPDYLAPLAASAALIHAFSATLASGGSPISAEQMIPKISESLRKILK